MNTKIAFSVAGLGFALSIFLGVLCFGDRFVTGCVVFLFLFTFVIARPLTFAFGRFVQHQQSELFRALVDEDHGNQDVVLAELDENTRIEFLRRLGRDAP